MNKVEFEQSLTKAVQRGVHQTLQPPVYLASGFFNKDQNELLTELESLLESQGINFISPRREGVVNPKSPMRDVLMNEIFQQNVRGINSSEKCYFIFDTSNRVLDMGTSWEFGYAIGQYLEAKKDLNNLIIYTPSDELQSLMSTIKDNLVKSLTVKSVKEQAEKTYIISKDNGVYLKDTVELLYNTTLHPFELNSVLTSSSVSEILAAKDRLLLIDNRPFQISILAGFLYSQGTSFRTASLKNFESNIMIAKSAKGHINLPGFYEPGRNSNAKFEDA